MDYGFEAKLATSRERSDFDKWAITSLLPDCETVIEGTEAEDKAGIDYYAILTSGRRVPIDAKSRKAGSRRYWKTEPELPMERYSVCPTANTSGKVGWTLDASKLTEYILFTFDPDDSRSAYLLPFQQLRSAFLRWGAAWKATYGKGGDWFYESSNGGAWTSAAVFVPVSVVTEAVRGEMALSLNEPVCARCGVSGANMQAGDGRLVCPGCHE
jgi:hypothetical protein